MSPIPDVCRSSRFRIVATLPLLFAMCASSHGVARAEDSSSRLPLAHLAPRSRIVLIGNALAERMQYFGHWETLLHSRFPRHELYVRNLGWSADELTLRPRSANFADHGNSPAHHEADVVLAFFGFNESFAGAAGLDKFVADLERFIRDTTTTPTHGTAPPKLILVTPLAMEPAKEEQLSRVPSGDFTTAQENLSRYAAAMLATAKRMNVPCVDLFTPSRKLLTETRAAQTINGVHLNEHGELLIGQILDELLRGARPGPDDATADPARYATLRAAVNEKNLQFFYDHRAVNGFYIYGGRKNPYGTINFPAEFRRLRAMTATRDRRIWDLAQGKSVPPEIDDSTAPPLPTIGTNVKAPIALTTPEDSRQLMKLPEGFSVNLFASEVEFPDLKNPVQFAFDARGRLWVTTMPSYPQYLPGKPVNDKILILEDTNGDGRADKQTVFADGLYLPTGIELGNGGVYVAQQPNLVFLRDTNGDDVADRRDILLHGFDSADSHHAISAFTWDPTGALYFQEGTFHHSQVETAYGPARCANAGVFRFEPRTGRVGVFVSYRFANPWGHVIDRWGQNFIADASPGFNYYGTAFSGDVDYPRKHGTMRQFLEKVWRPTAGCELVSSRNFPDDWQGNYLINNCIGFQGVLNYRMREQGSGFVAEAAEPLLQSSDPNFRPIDIKFGPDGSLYLCDWFNPLVGHMQHSLRDPNRDRGHGRIWRVHYAARPLVKPARIDGRPASELLHLLRIEPEERTRCAIRNELRARPTQNVMLAVDEWLGKLDARDPEIEHHRLEALWLQAAHLSIDRPLLEGLLGSPEPRARAAATRVLCYAKADAFRPCRLGPVTTDEILFQQIHDEHPRVRLEVIRALSFERLAWAADAAAELVRNPLDDYLSYTLRETFETLAGRIDAGASEERSARVVAPLLVLLKDNRVPPDNVPIAVELLCQHGKQAELDFVFQNLIASDKLAADVRRRVVEVLVDAAVTRKVRPAGDLTVLERLLADKSTAGDPAFQRSLQRLASLWKVASVASGLRRVIYDPGADRSSLQSAIENLAALDDPNSRELLVELTTRDSPSMRVRLLAVAAYAGVNMKGAASGAASTLSEASPTDDVGVVLDAFLNRKGGVDVLADALPRRPLHPDTSKVMLRHMYAVGRGDSKLANVLAEAAGLGEEPTAPSPAEVQQIVADVQSRGDARRGEEIFRRADLSCSRCHALNKAGGNVGPELTAVGSISPPDYIVQSILDPNLAVKEQYLTRVIVTTKGEVLTGIVVDRSESRVILRTATTELRIPTADIDEEAEGRSLMPQGLTRFLTRDELVDLVKFLSELGRPGPYALRTPKTIQRWRVSEPDAAQATEPAAFKAYPRGTWAPIYSRFDGALFASDLPPAPRDALRYLVGEFEVTTAGPLTVLLGRSPKAQVWLDEQPLKLDVASGSDGAAAAGFATATVEVARGRHRLAIDVRGLTERTTERAAGGAAGGVSVELVRPTGAKTEFEPVGGP